MIMHFEQQNPSPCDPNTPTLRCTPVFESLVPAGDQLMHCHACGRPHRRDDAECRKRWEDFPTASQHGGYTATTTIHANCNSARNAAATEVPATSIPMTFAQIRQSSTTTTLQKPSMVDLPHNTNLHHRLHHHFHHHHHHVHHHHAHFNAVHAAQRGDLPLPSFIKERGRNGGGGSPSKKEQEEGLDEENSRRICQEGPRDRPTQTPLGNGTRLTKHGRSLSPVLDCETLGLAEEGPVSPVQRSGAGVLLSAERLSPYSHDPVPQSFSQHHPHPQHPTEKRHWNWFFPRSTSPPPPPLPVSVPPSHHHHPHLHHQYLATSPTTDEKELLVLDFISRLSQDVRDVALLVSNDRRRQIAIESVLQTLNMTARRFSEARGLLVTAELYGSVATGLSLYTSDMNVTLLGHHLRGGSHNNNQSPFRHLSSCELLDFGHFLEAESGWVVQECYSHRLGSSLTIVVDLSSNQHNDEYGEEPQQQQQHHQDSSSAVSKEKGPTLIEIPKPRRSSSRSAIAQTLVIHLTANQIGAVESAAVVFRYSKTFSSFRLLVFMLKALLREWKTPREQMNATALTYTAMSFYSFHTTAVGRRESTPGQTFFCFLQMFRTGGLFDPRRQELDPKSANGIVGREVPSPFRTWVVRDVAPWTAAEPISSSSSSTPTSRATVSTTTMHTAAPNQRSDTAIASITVGTPESVSRTTSPPPWSSAAAAAAAGASEGGEGGPAESCYHVHLFQLKLNEAYELLLKNYFPQTSQQTTLEAAEATATPTTAQAVVAPLVAAPPMRAHLTAVLLPSLHQRLALPHPS